MSFLTSSGASDGTVGPRTRPIDRDGLLSVSSAKRRPKTREPESPARGGRTGLGCHKRHQKYKSGIFRGTPKR